MRSWKARVIACLIAVGAAIVAAAPEAQADTRARQTITVTSDPGTAPAGATYTPEVTSSSGLQVGISLLGGSTGCSLTGASVVFDTPGPCRIRYFQHGDDNYLPALGVTQDVEVRPVPVRLTVHVTPRAAGYGKPVTAQLEAVHTATGDHVDGRVTLSVDGSPLHVVQLVRGRATVRLPAGAATGTHVVDAALDPQEAIYGAASAETTYTVAKAATRTDLTVGPKSFAAHVSGASDTVTPTGRVRFFVDGRTVGSALLSGGVARFVDHLPARDRDAVAAEYLGSTRALPSSDSTAARDPHITARVTSAGERTAGWYRAPVVVHFTCRSTTRCPEPVRVTGSAGGQSVSGTVTNTAGGVATVTVGPIDVDRQAPSVGVENVQDGSTYTSAPTAQCVASDTLSGVASCRVTDTVTDRTAGVDTHQYRAVARDVAGNTSSVKGTYTVLTVVIDDATYENGVFDVLHKHGYMLVADDIETQPTYLDATQYPDAPTVPGGPLQTAGDDRWVLGIAISTAYGAGKVWNLGVQTDAGRVVLTIRID